SRNNKLPSRWFSSRPRFDQHRKSLHWIKTSNKERGTCATLLLSIRFGKLRNIYSIWNHCNRDLDSKQLEIRCFRSGGSMKVTRVCKVAPLIQAPCNCLLYSLVFSCPRL